MAATLHNNGTTPGRAAVARSASCTLAAFLVLTSWAVAADPPPDKKADPAKTDAASSDALPTSQQRLAEQYKELEKVLMRMRDLTRS